MSEYRGGARILEARISELEQELASTRAEIESTNAEIELVRSGSDRRPPAFAVPLVTAGLVVVTAGLVAFACARTHRESGAFTPCQRPPSALVAPPSAAPSSSSEPSEPPAHAWPAQRVTIRFEGTLVRRDFVEAPIGARCAFECRADRYEDGTFSPVHYAWRCGGQRVLEGDAAGDSLTLLPSGTYAFHHADKSRFVADGGRRLDVDLPGQAWLTANAPVRDRTEAAAFSEPGRLVP